MARIEPLTLDTADAPTADTLRAVEKKMGMVPNLLGTFALAPAAINGYLAFSDALSHGTLTAAQREIIALAVGQANECQYCLSAHTVIGKGAGLSDEAIQKARAGDAESPLDAAIAAITIKIVNQRGALSNEELASAQSAGVNNAMVVEIVANVAFNTLTNYTNHIAGTDIDFPVVAI